MYNTIFNDQDIKEAFEDEIADLLMSEREQYEKERKNFEREKEDFRVEQEVRTLRGRRRTSGSSRR